MTSIAVLAIGVGIVWLVFWAVKNEGASKVGEQSGLFRMRDWAAEQRDELEKTATQQGQRFAKRSETKRRADTTDHSSRPRR